MYDSAGDSGKSTGDEEAPGEGDSSKWDSLFERGDDSNDVSEAAATSTIATTEAALLAGATSARRSSVRVSKRKSLAPTRFEELRFPSKVTSFFHESEFFLQ